MMSLLATRRQRHCFMSVMHPRRDGSCWRRSLNIAEEVGVDDKVFPRGEREGDARQKTNDNMQAFHTRLVVTVLNRFCTDLGECHSDQKVGACIVIKT